MELRHQKSFGGQATPGPSGKRSSSQGPLAAVGVGVSRSRKRKVSNQIDFLTATVSKHKLHPRHEWRPFHLHMSKSFSRGKSRKMRSSSGGSAPGTALQHYPYEKNPMSIPPGKFGHITCAFSHVVTCDNTFSTLKSYVDQMHNKCTCANAQVKTCGTCLLM